MKNHYRNRKIVICVTLLLVLALFYPLSNVNAAEIDFPDDNLKQAIIDEGIDTNDDGKISISEAEARTASLSLSSRHISDISGLEYFTSLTELNLYNNNISDISALSKLTSLTYLNLKGNDISDISVLEYLTSLTNLNIDVNKVSDISPLADLTSLIELSLDNNKINDISHLSELTSLTDLDLFINQISDISDLAKLTSLTDLDLQQNAISDISVLSKFTSLTYLNLENNSISDISALSNLKKLDTLDLRNNSIRDIRALLNLNPDFLYLTGNPVYDGNANNGILLGNIEAYKRYWGFVDYQVWVPAGYITGSNGLSEATLDGATINIEVYPTTFADDTLDIDNFELINPPAGLSISSIEYIDDNECTVYLSYTGTDFDSDINNLGIRIKKAELSAWEADLDLEFVDDMPTLTPINDAESISIADDGEILEGTEDGEEITVNISGGTFNDEITPANWSVTNLPSGVSKGSVSRVDDTTVKINLSGNSDIDYDIDITDITVSCTIDEYIDSTGDSSLTASTGVTFTANNDDESISITDDGEIREGAEDGEEITVTISNGEFADSITPANWTVTNLPSGVSKGSVSRVDDTTVKITLSGNSYIDFDIDITDVTVSCTKDEYLDSTGDSSLTANTGVTISDPPELSSLSPATGTGDQGLDDNLVITFDEIVNKNTGYIRIYKVADDSLVESINVTETQVTGSGTDTITIALGAAPMC